MVQAASPVRVAEAAPVRCVKTFAIGYERSDLRSVTFWRTDRMGEKSKGEKGEERRTRPYEQGTKVRTASMLDFYRGREGNTIL
jgi:hypothetical protein